MMRGPIPDFRSCVTSADRTVAMYHDDLIDPMSLMQVGASKGHSIIQIRQLLFYIKTTAPASVSLRCR